MLMDHSRFARSRESSYTQDKWLRGLWRGLAP